MSAFPRTRNFLRLRHDVQARRLCGWNSAADIPSEGQFSVVNKEFVERGFAEKWFEDYVRTYVEGDPCATVSYNSAPILMRAKAENAKRLLEEPDPDQPVPPNRLDSTLPTQPLMPRPFARRAEKKAASQ